jgi:DNA (cytosine-5)-methyltransferase 1
VVLAGLPALLAREGRQAGREAHPGARVAGTRRPSVIILENVQEFRTWGPVRRGRPVQSKAGVTFAAFCEQLRALGYQVEDRVLDAADYGAPTHRRRLILIARRDGQPIVWPEPTHGPGRAHPYRTAAECIDWSLACPSIFERRRPLAEATQRRIAEGLKRFVFGAAQPFIIPVRTHGGGGNGPRSADLPLRTITCTKRGEFAAVAPYFVQKGQGERVGQAPRVRDVNRPYSTIVAGGVKQWLVAPWLVKHYGGVTGHVVERPIGTITSVDHHSVAEATLIPGTDQRARVVAAWVLKYFGTSTGHRADAPLSTILGAAQHHGLVTVTLDGEPWTLADIGMRMLTPRELARCQGFGEGYQLIGTQAQQVARIGNSVPPPLAEAVVRANVPPAWRAAA